MAGLETDDFPALGAAFETAHGVTPARVGNADVRLLPMRALVEVLPEEVAVKYGYRSNQKVVNVVLRKRFNAFTAAIERLLQAAVATIGHGSPMISRRYTTAARQALAVRTAMQLG